ncbi:MAG TPA: multicopper oxidase family protein [Acidobacteriaceae bacterium]|jgi:FtsP/CotA-like multicopper oxidase with cupredoxin domain|nr:multicopper oxidase family protein [Acidobacteriaceae bacterium]
MDRRQFLKTSSVLAAGCALNAPLIGENLTTSPAQTFKLDIRPVAVELAPGHVVHTIGYNGHAPGPLLRMREGVPVQVDVTNFTANGDLVHWHGLHIPSHMDGASEEGSPIISPGSSFRYSFTPSPSGSRWYHTHIRAGRDLAKGTYTGQYGFLYIDPKHEPGNYDQEIFLAVHHWEPSFTKMQETWRNCPEISYQYASLNDKLLGAGEPLRVKEGQRVLFHFLNASATENVLLSLPRHKFTVVALDGNPVPHPAAVEVLSLAVAERVDAYVDMTQPGTWVLGSTSHLEREKGLGVVVEYANQTGKAQWESPKSINWHDGHWQFGDWRYGLFSDQAPMPPEPAKLVTMLFEKKAAPGKHKDNAMGMDTWTINGKSFPDVPSLHVSEGERYRLRFVNATACAHPIHVHRHSFELKRVAEVPMAGILKDTVMLPAYGVVDVDLVANQPGPTLFHCHQQLHMDFGFMQLIEYA